MGDSYRYPIFFESPGLDEELKKRIENYFRIGLKSGGGDCSSVTKINDNVYSIAFKERGAQLRVLQKSEHVLEFAGCPLVLTVHSSISLFNTSTSGQSVSSKQDSSQQRQHSVLASSLPPSGEDYELQHDTYLLRYITECPKACKELDRELSAMSCSAQLYPQEGRAVVRSLAQPGAVDEVRDWKAEVDRFFKNYLCHYEVNPHKIKALLQSCSSCQTIDEVKVYSEVGVAVVVGECSQVNARLADVENATVKSQGSHLSEKQTSTVRLGEAKLRVLWKEIDYSLGRDFPGVKVSRGDAGQLVLEGSVEEILQATDCISKKENLVFERPVSGMSPHFFTFLRNSYGSPGKLGEFLGVDGKVEIELRDTELCLFTLSADKLNDTEKTLRDKFKEVKLDVPTCSAVPFELQMKLKSKTNQMNQGQCRAQVLFGLDSTVCLLGHTEEVEELSETVIQFILDQASIEGSVILPFQELVQLLPELLQLHGFDYSGVVFHPLPFSSEAIVALVGPSIKVTEVRNRLGPFLDSIVQDRVIIDLPGAERYFASPSGRDKLLNVACSQKCLIQLQKQPHISECNLASGVTAVANYSLCDGLQVLVCQGDITKQEADALVNAANEDLDHGGGVAAALSKAGGPEVQMESKALIRCNGKVPTGDVVVTTGGNLKCKKLLHAVGPVGGQAGGKERDLLEKTVRSALNLAEMMEFNSIAMPCITSGLFGVPVTVCCEAIVTAVKTFGSQGGRSLRRIILIDNRGEVVRAMQEACDRFLQGISPGNSTPSDLGFQVGAAAQHTARGAPAGGSVHLEVIQGTTETQQVDVLVSPMAGHSPCSSVVGSELSAKFEKEAATGWVILPTSFYRHVSATNDEITAMLGGVKLQMVLGDITNEGIDVIVNTTNFSNNPAGVSKAILTAAGPAVQAELAQVGIPPHSMYTTGAGFLGCREIIHANFMCDPRVIRKNCKKILKKCERERYCSVAFPAINTGAGGMDTVEACKAMLDGMVSAIRDLKPKFLSLIRIVILQQPIFQAFRSELENRFGQIAPPRLNLKEKAKQKLKKWTEKRSRTSTSSAPEEYPLTSSKPQPAIMSVICRRSDTMTIKRDLESILQNQLEEREVDVCDLSRLNDMELQAVKANIRVLGISVERRRHLPSESVSSNRARSTASAEARVHSGSGKDVYVLKGLKEDVLSITELVNRAVNKALCEDLQDKNEAMLALSIQWSIQDINGVWNELSLHDNYILEDAYIKNHVFVDLKAPDGMNVKVNLKEQQATDLVMGITYKVKRIETGTALELPPHWEPMHNEVFKKVEIQPNSPEYQAVAQGFHRTATYNIQKIERVQNLYLWYAYTVCRERILAKNGPAELGEKSLYHGTSAESCMCIERDKFDRRFAGAHAAMYGKGVYFAVNAEYSANGYSPPDASGLKRLYVACVLTGHYTVGRSTMQTTPPRGTDSTDCFDSLVDNQQQPSMFVIFHDDQAYPEYLITFN